jgi:hypothetical protein
MSSSRVQRLATRVLRNVQCLENVDCVVRLYNAHEETVEDFCRQIDDEVDTKYAEFDGARRRDHYLSMDIDALADVGDSCCATCLERAARQKRLWSVSRSAAESASAGVDVSGLRFEVVIVPGRQMIAHTSRGALSGDEHGFTVFMPGRARLHPSYKDTGENVRLMIQKDYLSDDPKDKQCCRCGSSVDAMVHTRCDKCMSWLCSVCMSEQPLLEGTWSMCCPDCGRRKDLLDAMNELAWHEKRRWKNVWRAIDEVMQRKRVDRIPVTIMDEEGSCFHTMAATTTKSASRTTGKKKRREVVFVGKNVPSEEQLTSCESVFVVGGMPDVGKGSESVRRSMRQGVVLSNTDCGNVIEVKDLFAPYSVLVSRDRGVAVRPHVEAVSECDSECDSDCDAENDRATSTASGSGRSHAEAEEVGRLITDA